MHWENCEFKAELKCQNALREDPFMSVPEIASQHNFPISNLPEGTIRERTFINANRISHRWTNTIDNDSDGCLQDVHWFAGLFGYFPTYSLGALTAAQFATQLRSDLPNIDLDIEKGKFFELVSWLKKNIHQKGSFYSTNEILEQVTKSSLDVKYFKNYINSRYL